MRFALRKGPFSQHIQIVMICSQYEKNPTRKRLNVFWSLTDTKVKIILASLVDILLQSTDPIVIDI